jgi:putative tryptophan/tyrosine transport system substrate-binding protein
VPITCLRWRPQPNRSTSHRSQRPSAPITLRSKIPSVSADESLARDGGLLSYGPDRVDIYARAATYVDRILRGAKPADLPVQLPVKFETVVNLRTASALGLAVPQSILLRADEVIE